MKILYILDPATRGGATESFLSLIHHVKRSGATPIVCTSNVDYLNDLLSHHGIQNFAIYHDEMFTQIKHGLGIATIKGNVRKFLKYIKHDIRAVRIIRKNIDLREIDIIHTNSSRSDVGFLLCSRFKIKHIVHLREFGDLDYNCYPLNPFWKTIYNKFSTQFVCVSNAIREYWIKKGIESKKTCTVYNGINFEFVRISSEKDKYQSTLRMVIVGGVMKSKGAYLIIEAMNKLPQMIKENVFLDIIGRYWDDEYKRSLDDIICKYGLSNKVNFLGERDDVLQIIADYQVGLMCSHSEGFGRVTAEYMFAGLGIIASNAGANPELLEDGKEGLLFESENSAALAKAIIYYYQNRDILSSHAKAARIKAEKCFTSNKYAHMICKIYNDINKN